MSLTFDSVDDLEQALRRAAAAHGIHEEETGEEEAEWPVWYAQYMERERNEQGQQGEVFVSDYDATVLDPDSPSEAG